jgi:phage tail sheath protein FI
MAYTTPGVYIEEITKFPPSVAEVETAIPAFIGHTEFAIKEIANDLLRKAVRITSLVEFEALFGGPPLQTITVNIDVNSLPVLAIVSTPSDYRMYYALRQYFDNGGGPCYIVSVGNYTNTITLTGLGNSGSATPGGLDIIKKIDEVTLIVFPDAQSLGAPSYYDLYDAALTLCADLKDRFTIIDLKRNGAAASDPVGFFRDTNGIGNENLRYGAAYWPWLVTTINFAFSNNTVTFSHPDDGTGSPGLLNGDTLTAALADSASAALITEQFLSAMKTEINKIFIEMPPSPAIAGVYAKVDSTRGVWKAPANISLKNVISPAVKINDADQDSLNVHPSGKSINAIRAFTGKGILVWGARTLAGNDNEWRYINVRRFFNMAEESIKKATEQFVFDPNDANTWTKVRGMIENFLILQWRQGALAGAKPEDAFYVSVGLGQTMTALDILEGRMIVEIGLAAVRPAEFIILKFSHKMLS